MIRKVWYKAKDAYYSDQVQSFIGISAEELDEQEYEFDKWLGREHPAGLMFIYQKSTIYESDCDEIDKEIYLDNYRRYQEQAKSSCDRSAKI